MKFVAISDTHTKHRLLHLPKGDVILHAGDVSVRGTEFEILDFLDWFSRLDFEYRIFVAGNHDFFLEHKTEEELKQIIPKNIIYLKDSGININGINIWGSPLTPVHREWAFQAHRGSGINKYWKFRFF